MAKVREFDLFFSYNQDSSNKEVDELYDKIQKEFSASSSVSIWIDYEQLIGNGSLASQIMSGLKNSSFILCFVTKEYSQSDNCKCEMSTAKRLNKPHAILMLDHYDDLEDDVKFKIVNDSRLNFYKNKTEDSLWTGRIYEQLIRTIDPYIKPKVLGNLEGSVFDSNVLELSPEENQQRKDQQRQFLRQQLRLKYEKEQVPISSKVWSLFFNQKI